MDGDPARCPGRRRWAGHGGPGLVRRRGWARWAAVVAFSLLGVAALAQLVDWIRALVRSRAYGWGWGPAPIDLVTQVLFLAVSVGVVVLLMTPATRRDFRSSRQPPADTNGRQQSSGPRQA